MIDNVPLPERQVNFDFVIPKDLLHQFKDDVRIVVKFPWIVGIPAPEYLFKDPEIFGKLEKFDVMIVPKMMR